jgi:hypothetical protein
LNLLDENFPEDQQPLLRQWHIPFRQVGRELARPGAQDADLLTLLHRQRRATFFTQDRDFFHPRLCHAVYCLAFLDVRVDDTADFLRRFLRHRRFDSAVKRMGLVARVHHDGVHFWQRNRRTLQFTEWP